MPRVLAALSMFAIAGKLAAMSLDPYVFGLGINSSREGLKGLLFFFCVVLYIGSVVTVGLVAVRTRKTQKGEVGDDDLSLQEMES